MITPTKTIKHEDNITKVKKAKTIQQGEYCYVR